MKNYLNFTSVALALFLTSQSADAGPFNSKEDSGPRYSTLQKSKKRQSENNTDESFNGKLAKIYSNATGYDIDQNTIEKKNTFLLALGSAIVTWWFGK